MDFIKRIPKAYRIPLLFAVLLHVVILIALVVHVTTSGTNMSSSPKAQTIINAHAVSAQQVERQVQQVVAAAQQKQQEEEQEKARVVAKTKAAERLREQQQLAQEKQQQLKIKAQQIAKVKAQKHREQLAQAKQASIKKREQENKFKALQEKLMQQQFSNEQTNIAQARQAQIQGIVDQYKRQIVNAISQYWLIPGGVNKELSAIFLIQVAPGGMVLNVHLVHSSGNAALDESAKVAIFKASPLPVPKDPAAFDHFRELRLTVSPREIVNG